LPPIPPAKADMDTKHIVVARVTTFFIWIAFVSDCLVFHSNVNLRLKQAPPPDPVSTATFAQQHAVVSPTAFCTRSHAPDGLGPNARSH
jgi:hypothetical protein